MRLGALLLLLPLGCGPVQASREPHERHEPFAEWREGLQAGARPTSPEAVPPRFGVEEQVESVVSPAGRFRVHFSRVGPNAVVAGDVDGNGVPDAVDVVAHAYDRVAAFYLELGFLLPGDDASVGEDHGGDGLFDVYLVDFAGRADGAFRLEGCEDEEEGARCVGHMLQENDFAGYSYPSFEAAVNILASHEFFHAVQAAYRPGLGNVASEGSAVWASERFDSSLDDLESFSSSYLSRPDRSLVVDPTGPAVSFSYGAGLFFQYLGERFGDRVVRAMWEESVVAPAARWPVLVDTVLRREWGADFDTAFAEFAQWNLATGARAGAEGGYARGGGYDGLVLASRTLPTEEAQVRVPPAATRYFEVPGGSAQVLATFTPDTVEDPPKLHLLVAAVTADAVLRVSRAEGPGVLSAQVAASDATHVVIAVVDGHHEGTGRYGQLCITGAATGAPCAEVVPDPEEPARPSDDGGCGAAPGGLGWSLLALIVLAGGKARSAVPARLRPSPRRRS
ncbi:MXAN_6640 family putative metalloprotease [Pyxidicoccus trucidator]|uniref:MXAN_6640 family putative metalloprotease n=1 Tax=Pyxidicoccus trucidator TaxID=2709662 RepID=UPI0013DAD58B|nr:MXAN_6640 family putative metalloprotease [Pyxidicoccus trucidator]